MCIKTLNEFIEWAAQLKDGQYLFRGVSNECYKLEASACRRLQETDRYNPSKLLKINRELIAKARSLGHDQKDGRQLSDLELLAELQHFSAATCLIDFSRNALVALWFACQTSSEGEANGKVYAVNRNDTVRLKTVTHELITKDINHFLMPNEKGEYLIYQWQPKLQNNRIIAQQSEFLLSGAQIEEDAKCVIDKDSKQDIQRSLEQIFGITEGSIYPDFDGFARLHAHNKKHIEPDARFYLQRGIEAQHNDNLDDAIEYYTEVILLEPADHVMFANAYNNRGIAYNDKGEVDYAIEDYDKALQLNPDNVKVYSNRGNAYADKGEYDRAIEDHNNAIEIMRNFAPYYVNRGNAYAGKGEYDRAIEDFNTALQYKPNLAAAYVNRGIAYSDKKEYEKAVEDYNKAIELEPNDARVYNNRGTVYSKKGQYDQAIEDYNKAIELNPDLAEPYTNRGDAYVKKDMVIQAITDHNKAIELKPDLAGAYYNRGIAWLIQQEFKNAKEDLTIARDKQENINIELFREDYENVADFEQKHNVKLPEGIAAMLTHPPQA